MDIDTIHSRILGALPFPLFACDEQMRIIYMNISCEELTGVKLEAARGRRWNELIGEAGTSLVSIPSTGVTVGIIDIPGRETSIARILSEKALAESDQRFRELTDALPEVVFEADASGRVTYANRHAFQLFGYADEDFAAGITVFDLVDPAETGHVAGNWQKRVSGSAVGPVEYRIRRKDGSGFPGLINVAPVRRDGMITGMRGILIDISRQKEAEEALRQSEARFRALTESTPAIIYIYQDGRMQYVNPAAEKVFGYPSEELRSAGIFEKAIHQDSREEVVRRMAARDHGESVSARYEVKIVTKSGEERLLDLSSNAVEFNGRPAVIGSAFDITEARKLEEEILKMRKLESLGVLAGGIAHDFNNLLTAIIGNVSLAKLTLSKDHPVYRNLVEVENASLRARDLTHQLLTFSKGGAPVKKTVSADTLLRETIRFTLSGSNLLPGFAIPDDIWAADIDEGQISQVINNIAMNAAQASPSGGSFEVAAANIALDSSYGVPLSPGRYLRISFTDRGTGMPSDVLSRVFDPYFTTKKSGNGLGLTTAFSIIKRHGGHLMASSRPGEGSTFTMYLPASAGSARTAREEPEAFTRSRGKILLMDDDSAVLQVAEGMLGHLGYETVSVRDGAETIKAYMAAKEGPAPFDAVIMDLTIPGGMGAMETVESLRHLDPSLTALVSSGYSNDPILAEHRKHGFAGTITKPYNVNEIAAILRAVVHSREA